MAVHSAGIPNARVWRKPFGKYTLVSIGDADNYVSVVAERSAYVHEISLAGKQLLWNYDSGEALTQNSKHRNLALLPFPNRLLEGRYTWAGKEHAFAVNKPETRSALHGFGPHAPFSLDRVDLAQHTATLKLSYLHRPESHSQQYPFLVRFEVAITIDTQHSSCTWSLSATNLGEQDVPVGLGWHPYYLLPGGLNAWKVMMPPNEQVVLAKAIPTGERSKGLPADTALAINTEWDDCFSLLDSSRRTVMLTGAAYQLTLKQLGDTRYTQLFVPPTQTSLAIEPMSCNVNAFQDAQHEVRLAAGQTTMIGVEHTLKLS